MAQVIHFQGFICFICPAGLPLQQGLRLSSAYLKASNTTGVPRDFLYNKDCDHRNDETNCYYLYFVPRDFLYNKDCDNVDLVDILQSTE